MSIGIDWLAEDIGERDKVGKIDDSIAVEIKGRIRGLKDANKSEEVGEVDESALVDIGTQEEAWVNGVYGGGKLDCFKWCAGCI